MVFSTSSPKKRTLVLLILVISIQYNVGIVNNLQRTLLELVMKQDHERSLNAKANMEKRTNGARDKYTEKDKGKEDIRQADIRKNLNTKNCLGREIMYHIHIRDIIT